MAVKRGIDHADHKTRDLIGGFDVTTVIGRVEFGDGDETPHEAAFKLIAQYDVEGTFKFPMADGRTCSVTVEWEGEANV